MSKCNFSQKIEVRSTFKSHYVLPNQDCYCKILILIFWYSFLPSAHLCYLLEHTNSALYTIHVHSAVDANFIATFVSDLNGTPTFQVIQFIHFHASTAKD